MASKLNEVVKFKINLHEIKDNQSKNSSNINQNKRRIKTLISFNIVIDDFIQNNKRIFAAIEMFRGGFTVDVSKKEIPKVIHEFL